MFREALLKYLNDNPEIKRIFEQISIEIKGKNQGEKIKIYNKWQKELRQVADKQAHQTD